LVEDELLQPSIVRLQQIFDIIPIEILQVQTVKVDFIIESDNVANKIFVAVISAEDKKVKSSTAYIYANSISEALRTVYKELNSNYIDAEIISIKESGITEIYKQDDLFTQKG
jgi:subtilase family serine protease